MPSTRKRSPLNKTIELSEREREHYRGRLLHLDAPATLGEILGGTICQDTPEALPLLPENSADLIFVDPPYNLSKTFNERKFKRIRPEEYEVWLESWIQHLPRILKDNGSIYFCGDWLTSSSLHRVASRHFIVRNRITWEREKGRGSTTNWKNSSEDIWFCTASNDYNFNVDAVKIRRRVVAPYRVDGVPKDWDESSDGQTRLTHPSNLWTDISVPFWSMPENTDHPTQKPEKLLAKVILASSNEGDVVFDPFLGSGTTSVVSRKLGRQFFGIE
ncbi:MAG: DNA methyltransferase, partial [Planctomycetota bacterium]|nr:DNA methyltransferase [Planctomycetota bacterium]